MPPSTTAPHPSPGFQPPAHGAKGGRPPFPVATLRQQPGLLLRCGALVDATWIAAPSSTETEAGVRDPDMHQTPKGKNGCFGMKAHIGVNADAGLVHSLVGSAAKVHDVTQAHAQLHAARFAYGGM